MSVIDPQPAPIARADRTPSWELVMVDARRIGAPITERILDDMAERHATGTKKYGVPLTAGDGRNHLIDAYQEALDLMVYLRQELDERGVSLENDEVTVTQSDAVVLRLYVATFGPVVSLRNLIDATVPK